MYTTAVGRCVHVCSCITVASLDSLVSLYVYVQTLRTGLIPLVEEQQKYTRLTSQDSHPKDYIRTYVVHYCRYNTCAHVNTAQDACTPLPRFIELLENKM